MPTAIAHAPPFTVPGSSTSTALVRWNGTGGNQIQDSTILVGATTMGLAADTDLVTFSSGTLTIAGTVAATTLTGAGAGITALAAANITASGTLPALNGAALTALTAANITASGTLPALNGAALTALNGTQVTTGTLPAARIAADSIVEAKLDVSNGPTNGQFLQAQSGEGGGLTWAAAGISSTIESFTRTASAGAGTQSLTGAGFTPKAAFFIAGDGGAAASWGFIDDADNRRNIYHNAQNGSMTTTIFSLAGSEMMNVRNNTSGSNQMYAQGSLTSNGVDIVWSKNNSGVDVTGYVMYLG